MAAALWRIAWFPLLSALFAAAVQADAAGFVKDAAIDHLVDRPAELFDLQGKTVRFSPKADGSYLVETLAKSNLLSGGQMLEDAAAEGPWYSKGWGVKLPFLFPFAGKNWDHLYVNMNGNISFEKPESQYWPQRNPWPDGGMCSVAAVIDARAAAGLEPMIAAFWGPYQNPSVSQVMIRSEPDGMLVTWNMTRAAWGQAVLGVNTFQARLFPSGVVEFAYGRVAERDGIVGLFTGQPVKPKLLNHWQYRGKAPHADVDIDSGDVYDAGTVLDLAITMKHDLPPLSESGPMGYSAWFRHDGRADQVALDVSDQPSMSCWLGASPRTAGWQIGRNRVDLFVSKLLVAGAHQCSVEWSASSDGVPGRWVNSGDDAPPFDLGTMDQGTVRFATADEIHSGNIYEAFHYPLVTKTSERLLQSIYKQFPARDDIAIVFTDFRIDDLYGQGGGAIAANFPIHGLGPGNENPRSTSNIGSNQLQMSIATVWLGSPLFEETGTDDSGVGWYHFARGVKWIAHECTHRWGLNLSFINPNTGKPEKLTDGVGHWRDEIDSTAVFPVTSMFLRQSGVGASIMGGYAWRRNSDGTFSRSDYPFIVPGGYSALDLYIMGFLPPQRVPVTGVIEDMMDLGSNRYQGALVPVRIEDIVAAMGPRIPSSTDSQKKFQMSFYLVHEPGRGPDPRLYNRAQRLSVAVAAFFLRATGGVMKVVPTELH
jgi:hypothetical protein